MTDIQEETGDIFNLEATPGEGTAYRLAMMDKKQYPDIICANERLFRERRDPFYTNSSQLPVNYTDDIFEALMLQDELQTKYTGGTVFHIFLGEQISDIEATKAMVRKIAGNFRLPYFTLTPTFSVCPAHGYINGAHEKCTVCDHETEVYSRIVGYLRPVRQWNNGKQTEFHMRKTYIMDDREEIPCLPETYVDEIPEKTGRIRSRIKPRDNHRYASLIVQRFDSIRRAVVTV